MNEHSRLFANSRNYPLRLAVYAVGLSLSVASGAAGAAPDDNSVRGASSIARASATIINPASVRAVDLENIGTDFGRTPGLAVAPAAVVRRDCADERAQQRCNLIIIDLP